jgi:chromosome segregation ATPase
VEWKSSTNKTNRERDSYMKDVKTLKDENSKLAKDNESLNLELDQYENESKAMDKEIKRLNKENKLLKEKNDKLEKENEELNLKIEELNSEIDKLNKRIKELLIEIEKLKAKLEEIESEKYKGKNVPKDKKALFCYLCKSFSEKVILKYKLDMFIGMFMRKIEKDMQIKINKLKEINENYQKRIQALIEENENYKKRLNQEEEKDDQMPGDNENNKIREYKHNRSISQGELSKFIGSQIGNTIITTKTTQISYKKRRRGGKV